IRERDGARGWDAGAAGRIGGDGFGARANGDCRPARCSEHGGASIVSEARSVLSAAGPVGAYQAYLDVASGYVESSARGVDSAMQDVRDVEFLAFDPIRDSAALRKVDGALAGHVLTVDSVGGAK